MESTYTYTARSLDDPARVMTFTLHDHSLSVGMSPPLEQVERAMKEATAERETDARIRTRPWLKPMVVSLLERTTHPFHIDDIDARVNDDRLWVRAWIRSGGLRLAPITLISGPVDNPPAAQAFVEELDRRQESAVSPSKLIGPLDYWATWLLVSSLIVAMTTVLQIWRRKRDSRA
jgi:hypothetical protein